MLDADVLKIKCEFVTKVISFLKTRRYVIDTCYKSIISYYSDMILVTKLIDCISSEDECDLTFKANHYGGQDPLNPDITPCNDQATIVLSSSITSCNGTYSAVNTLDGGNLPIVILNNNSLLHDAGLNLQLKTCGTTYSTPVICGCSGHPQVCVDVNRLKFWRTFTLNNVNSTYAGYYIKKLNLGYTNSSGVYAGSVDLNIAPSNIAAWTGCGSCEAIIGSDLILPSLSTNNTAYKTAWEKLMRNVGRVLGFSLEGTLAIYTIGSSQYEYDFAIKHNPNAAWAGIYQPTFSYTISNGVLDQVYNTSQRLGQVTFLSQSAAFSTPCGSVTIKGDSFAGATAAISNTSNFNKVVLSNPALPLPITVSVTSGVASCSIVTLSAAITTLNAISSVQWVEDLTSTIIGTTNTIQVPAPVTLSDYTFTIILTNGCHISKTISVAPDSGGSGGHTDPPLET